jgi:hypothetical protein
VINNGVKALRHKGAMGKAVYILLPLLLICHSCKKNDIQASGTITIDNTLTFDQTTQSYFGYGFLFSKAELVSTLDNPGPDITVDSDGTNVFFQAENYKNSFYMVAEFDDAASAEQAFSNMTAPVVNTWAEWANPVNQNQIWIYRSDSEHYAKLRIISIVSEVRDSRDFAECTFEWVYQPDGSLTFPGK